MEADQKRLAFLGEEGLYQWVEILQLRATSATHLLFMELKLRKAKAKANFDNLYRHVVSLDEEVEKVTTGYLRVVGQRDEAR